MNIKPIGERVLLKPIKKEEKTTWICRECGYIYVGEQAPNTCPVCKYPKAFFEVKSDNF